MDFRVLLVNLSVLMHFLLTYDLFRMPHPVSFWIEACSGTFFTSKCNQVTQPLEEVIVCRYRLTTSNLQRILWLNATGKKISVLEHVSDCEMVNTDFPAYYDD